MKISVIGAGYVGLTTAACLAELGHEVFCADNDERKLDSLKRGQLPFFEPYLTQLVRNNCAAERLCFVTTEDAIDHGLTIFICVGTPPLNNGEADLSAIEQVARTIAKRAHGYRLIVEKSTVPVQTAHQLRRHLSIHSANGLRYDVAANPEFLREGNAIEDFFHPDRIVVGVDSERSDTTLRQVYEPLLNGTFACPVHGPDCTRPAVPFLVTDTNSTEVIKHASNSFLATKISFVNMLADLCEATGADIRKVTEGMGLDSRIGRSFLRPGIGFGGFCFPKDLQAFVRIAEKFGCDFSLLKEAELINQRRCSRFVEKIRKELWVLRGKRIALWGLAFKPNTDDVRFAPSLSIIRQLLAEGAEVRAYDPEAIDKAKAEIPNITYCCDVYDAATHADAIVVLTEWDEFLSVNWSKLHSIVDRPLVIDGRNCLSGDLLVTNGFHYVGVGGVSAVPQEAGVSISA